MGAAILSFLGRPFFLFSTTSPTSISSSGFLLPNIRFLLIEAILSSLSLLVSSLFFKSFRAERPSLGLLVDDKNKGMSPEMEEMTAVTPVVAFDLSVNLEPFVALLGGGEVSMGSWMGRSPREEACPGLESELSWEVSWLDMEEPDGRMGALLNRAERNPCTERETVW
ncbi:hypothetical protein F7725_013297 [Dissostichus mawsoni]|uniref:Uncharacterized protein n=1 Tax=Dissostichus mawsoni TaxID=36200 RepID=A0A7J5YQ16_DISMA|nr:hypothetical protein F7725_013297 [Dissostichus mawsoni]